VNNGGVEVYDINNNQLTGAAFMGAVGLNWQFSGVGGRSRHEASQEREAVRLSDASPPLQRGISIRPMSAPGHLRPRGHCPMTVTR
jgi:hypothetical protein